MKKIVDIQKRFDMKIWLPKLYHEYFRILDPIGGAKKKFMFWKSSKLLWFWLKKCLSLDVTWNNSKSVLDKLEGQTALETIESGPRWSQGRRKNH